MNVDRYEKDLKDIREMMSRSSKFLSLSGLSGVSAGILALLAAYTARQLMMGHFYVRILDDRLMNLGLSLVLLASFTLLMAIALCIYFTLRKARKDNSELWNEQSRRVVIHLFIPLAAGGLLCLISLGHGYLQPLAPMTLIFYGLGLINASHYTVSEIRSLGLAQIVIGLLAAVFISNGLIFWAIGFGVLHIVYGLIMYVKYES